MSYPPPGGMPPPHPSQFNGPPPGAQSHYGAPPPQHYPAPGAPPPSHYPQAASAPPSQHAGGAPSGWAGGYFSQAQQQEVAALQAWFQHIDRDRSGSISAHELLSADFGGFRLSFDSAVTLMKIFDKDRSGTISFPEYVALHKFIQAMRAAFFQFDRDRSGALDRNEVHQALAAANFRFSPATIDSVIQKFSLRAVPGQQPGTLSFEQFLQMSGFLGQLRSVFEWNAQSQRVNPATGPISLNLDQLVQIASFL